MPLVRVASCPLSQLITQSLISNAPLRTSNAARLNFSTVKPEAIILAFTCRVRNLEYAEACLGRSGVSEASQLGIGDVKRTGGDLKIDLRAVRFACDGLSVADNGDVLGNLKFFRSGIRPLPA